MNFRIYCNRSGVNDSVVISGNTIKEVKEKAKTFCESHNWDIDKCWSELI